MGFFTNFGQSAMDAVYAGRSGDMSDLLYADGLGDPLTTGNSMYDKLLANNPYRKQTYNLSGWQSFLRSMGIRTGYDKWSEDVKTQAAEYDSRILELMQQNQFNDPAAEASRARGAGINPDLVGLDSVPEAATQAPDPNGLSPTSTDAESFGIVANVGQTILDLIPGVMSFAKQIQEFRGLRLDNDNKELSFDSGVQSYVEDFFLNNISEQDYREAFEKNDWTNILDAAKKTSDSLSRSLFTSKKARNRFNLTYGAFAGSLRSKLSKYKTWDEFESARKSLLGQRASRMFSDDDAEMISLTSAFIQPFESYQQTMREIQKEYAEQYQKLGLPTDTVNLENAQIQNQLAYEATIDPVAQAEAENATNKAVEQQQKIVEATNQLFEDIMKNLQKSDSWWSKIAMALVGIARAQLLSGMQLEFGRRQQINSKTGNVEVLDNWSLSN